MSKNFIVNGIISTNCFKEENQIDINVSITPINEFLRLAQTDYLMKHGILDECSMDDYLESTSLLFCFDSDDENIVDVSNILYVQPEVYSSCNDEYSAILKSISSEEEIDEVRQYIYNFLVERQKQSKLWTDYLG